MTGVVEGVVAGVVVDVVVDAVGDAGAVHNAEMRKTGPPYATFPLIALPGSIPRHSDLIAPKTP